MAGMWKKTLVYLGLMEEDEEFEVVEVFDRALILSGWRRPDGGEAGFGDFPFAEDELCRPTLSRI